MIYGIAMMNGVLMVQEFQSLYQVEKHLFSTMFLISQQFRFSLAILSGNESINQYLTYFGGVIRSLIISTKFDFPPHFTLKNCFLSLVSPTFLTTRSFWSNFYTSCIMMVLKLCDILWDYFVSGHIWRN